MIDLYPLLRPLFFRIDPEDAHRLAVWGLAVWGLARGFGPKNRNADPPVLASRLWGRDFANPIGLAAGFDKDARAVDALLDLGFGFVEAGSVTPRPQPGNPRPRLFRSVEDGAVINRMGFNNQGLDAFADRLARRQRRGIVGANVGRNKDTEDAGDDYALGVRRLAPLADYLVVNVSSPNTPGLRALQGRAQLAALLDRVLAAREASGVRPPVLVPPILVKVAPDLTAEDRRDVAAVALAAGIDGLVVGNTTLSRPPGLASGFAAEAGGLSGRPLFDLSTEVLTDFYRLTEGRLPLIGAGGVASGADAYAKIRAGASLVQLYSALVFAGPSLVSRIKRDLAALLAADGFATVAAAVGADHRGSGGQQAAPRP